MLTDPVRSWKGRGPWKPGRWVTTRSSAAAIKDGDEGDHKRQNRNKMVSIHHRRSPPVNIVPLIVLS
jgi:hypothetical protein